MVCGYNTKYKELLESHLGYELGSQPIENIWYSFIRRQAFDFVDA